MIGINDAFGRPIEYLRISVTDRCNLRCVYCMPEHGVPYENRDELLSVEEIMRLVRLLSLHGLKKVRITGGEPLVRARDVIRLVAGISDIPTITDLGLTTNAVLLSRNAADLWRAGLRRINISMDTMVRERFAQISRVDQFDAVNQGLASAFKTGFNPIKLNMVVMRGLNDDEVANFAELSTRDDVQVRFLEYMPIGQVTPWEWRRKYVSSDEVLGKIADRFELEPIATASSSTSRIFRILGAPGTVGVVSPMSHKFCAGCNRLRLTANGALVPCLSDNYEYDLRSPLRSGATDEELLGHVRKAIANKPEQSDFEGRVRKGGSIRIMAQIGG